MLGMAGILVLRFRRQPTTRCFRPRCRRPAPWPGAGRARRTAGDPSGAAALRQDRHSAVVSPTTFPSHSHPLRMELSVAVVLSPPICRMLHRARVPRCRRAAASTALVTRLALGCGSDSAIKSDSAAVRQQPERCPPPHEVHRPGAGARLRERPLAYSSHSTTRASRSAESRARSSFIGTPPAFRRTAGRFGIGALVACQRSNTCIDTDARCSRSAT